MKANQSVRELRLLPLNIFPFTLTNITKELCDKRTARIEIELVPIALSDNTTESLREAATSICALAVTPMSPVLSEHCYTYHNYLQGRELQYSWWYAIR